MPTARRTEAAERDLQEIAFHIAFTDQRPLTADRVIDELIAEADKLARFDPRTNTFVEFPLPSRATGIKRIAMDPSNSNRVWWCATGSNRAGYVEVIE